MPLFIDLKLYKTEIINLFYKDYSTAYIIFIIKA